MSLRLESSYDDGKFVKVEKFRLQNDLRIIILEDHSVPIFAYHTWLDVGSRNEKEGQTGMAHLFEHLMFKGTRSVPDGALARMIEENGGHLNAATSTDFTFYRESLPKEAFDLIPKLEADRMQNLTLNDAQLSSEREVVANERRMRVDNNPGGRMYEELFRTAFRLHPYHWPVIGWMKDIESMQLNDCIEFYKTFYAPNHACIVVTGAVETPRVLDAIEAAYGSIASSGSRREEFPVEPDQTEERRETLKLPIPVEKLLIGYRIPNVTHPDIPALEVANAILFSGRSARVYRKLVTDLHIASTANGWVYPMRYPGLYIVETSLHKGKSAQELESQLYGEFDNLASSEISLRELDTAKNRLEMTYWRQFRTADQKAQALGSTESLMGDFRLLFDEVRRYRDVTEADVRRVVKKCLRVERRTVIHAIPSPSKEIA